MKLCLHRHYVGEKSNGWGYLSIDGKTVHKQMSKGYGIKYGRVGDRIGVRLDCDVGQLSFSVNNVDQGVAFDSSSLKNSNLTICYHYFVRGKVCQYLKDLMIWRMWNLLASIA